MIDNGERMGRPRRFRGFQVECSEHEGVEAIIALLDRDADGIWRLRPSSRSLRHTSTESPEPSGQGFARFTLRCRRCEATRCDTPATIRGDTLSRMLHRLEDLDPARRMGLANSAFDRFIVTRRLLTS